MLPRRVSSLKNPAATRDRGSGSAAMDISASRFTRVIKRGSAKSPTKLPAEKFLFLDLFSLNNRLYSVTFRSKIFSFSDAPLKNIDDPYFL
jgi:hypothetical protein